MEARALITRHRGEQDRRVVTAKISESGTELLARVNPVINAAHVSQFQAFSDSQIRQIKSLMQKLLK
jgi:DNA-binding MarR family transcriptional regulator